MLDSLHRCDAAGDRRRSHGAHRHRAVRGDRASCSRNSLPAAARWRDRSSVRAAVTRLGRLCGRRRKAEALGDRGFGGVQQHGDQRRQVEAASARTCRGSAPWRVRLPPHTLRMTTAGRMACSARQLVASSEGSHKKRNTAGNSLATCAAERSASYSGGGASTSRPRRAVSRPRAVAVRCSLNSAALQRSRRSRPAFRTACTSPAQGLSGWSS